MQREELLTKRKIFQDEVPARTQGVDNPADEDSTSTTGWPSACGFTASC